MLTISEVAAVKIKEMLAEQKGNNDVYLRIGVKGGGGSGLSYGMGFDQEISEGEDHTFEQHDIKIVVKKDTIGMLEGVVIDFKQNMMGGGFTIDNPNAIATCGCGSSFRTKENEGTPEEC